MKNFEVSLTYALLLGIAGDVNIGWSSLVYNVLSIGFVAICLTQFYIYRKDQ